MPTDTKEVPKFGSFKFKPRNLQYPAKKSDKEAKATTTAKQKHHDAHDKTRQAPSSDSNTHVKQVSIDRDVDKTLSKQILVAADELFDLCFSDLRGDQRNADYGSADRYNVPMHRPFGSGYVLGHPRARIDRHTSSLTYTVLFFPETSQGQGMSRVLSSQRLQSYSEPMPKDLHAFDLPTTSEHVLRKDFMELAPNRETNRLPIITPKG